MRKKLLALIFVLFILSLFIGSVSCDTQTVTPSDDVWVYSAQPNDNFNYHPFHHTLEASRSNGFYWRTWIKFIVPSDLTITKAEVYLYQWGAQASPHPNVTIHASSNVTWSEDTITWNDQPSFNSTVIDFEIVSAPNVWYSWDVTANVTSGSNASFMLKTETSTEFTYCCSKEYVDSERWPYLKLTIAEGEGEEEEEADINLVNVPLKLGERLGISAWSGGMLLSALLLFPINMILFYWKKGGIGALIFNFAMLGIFTSVGWLPVWTVILIGIVVVAISGLKIKDVL